MTFVDRLQDLKRRRTLKPCLIVLCLQFFNQFSCYHILLPYIIQVLTALGTPIKASYVTIINGGVGIVASIFLISIVKRFGRRVIYLISSVVVAFCSFGLGKCQMNIFIAISQNQISQQNIIYEQEFTDSFFFHRIGHHLEVQMNRQEIRN